MLIKSLIPMAATTTTTTTVTVTATAPSVLTLKLKRQEKASPAPAPEGCAVTWEEGTVDNEHLGKKSSKACCIFHKPRSFGESDSDESDSDWEGFDDSAAGGGEGGKASGRRAAAAEEGTSS